MSSRIRPVAVLASTTAILLACTCASAEISELTGAMHLDAGGRHACVLTSGGAVKCWGRNGNGELGDGTFASRSWAANVAGLESGALGVAASRGWDDADPVSHTCAIDATGDVLCWGDNEYGQLGLGTVSGALAAPLQAVSGLGAAAVAVSAGWAHTCALLATGGVKCWGDNFYGQLGDGTTTSRLVGTDVVGLASGVVAISAGPTHTCAVVSTGGAKCWGSNRAGEVGDDRPFGTERRLTPADVVGLTSGVASISAGGTPSYSCYLTGSRISCYKSTIGLPPAGGHSCAVTAGGAAKCWGHNHEGQIGGSGDSSAVARDVPGLASGVTAISAGGERRFVGCPICLSTYLPQAHSCAATAGGGAKCWGTRACGRLGDGLAASCEGPPVNEPIDVVNLSQVQDVAAGGNFSCALVSGGRVRCWGLGYGSSPVAMYAAPLPTPFAPPVGPERLGNLSTRATVLTGNDAAIAGFVVAGTAPKKVLVTAKGPSMMDAGVLVPLADPSLTLVRMEDQTVVAGNDNWIDAINASEIQGLGLAPEMTAESAILITLAPGAYTAIVSGSGGEPGIGLVEVHEVDAPAAPLLGISTRARVEWGDGVMIAGFSIRGDAPKKVIVTGKGPSLAQHGVSGTLADPTLVLVRMSDQAIVASNDNWSQSSSAGEVQASGFAPTEFHESAILITLEPGLYTAILGGARDTTGVGLVEVYAVP